MSRASGSSQTDDEGRGEEEERSESESSSLDQSVRAPPTGAGAATTADTNRQIRELANRVHRKLCVNDADPLAVKAHRSAVNSMVQLRDLLQRLQVDADREVRMLLLAAGIAVQRRMSLGSDGDEASDLSVTQALLFMLQVLCDQRARNLTPNQFQTEGVISPSLNPPGSAIEGEPMEVDAPPKPAQTPDQGALERWAASTLLKVMQDADKRAEQSDDPWSSVLVDTPDFLSRCCLREGPHMRERGTLARLNILASTFFRSSAMALQYSMLLSAGAGQEDTTSFLTLGCAEFMQSANPAGQDEKLAAIVDAAESESGQQILRDIILSFTLPQGVVGTRRTPLLGREANRIATEQHTVLLGNAHEAAMRGAEWSWSNDPEPIHKMAALLAGLCILFATRGGTTDNIRKSDAFAGRVQLPFLETMPPPANLSRLGFIPHKNEWLVYSITPRGTPKVQLRHRGFEGLCLAALLMTSHTSMKK